MEKEEGGKIKFQISDGSVFVFPMSEVEKIEERRHADIPDRRRGIPRGFHFYVDYSQTYSFDWYESYDWYERWNADFGLDNYPSLSITAGYQFNPYIFAGVGIGISFFDPEDDKIGVPIFADARVNFLDRRVSPYVEVRIGGTTDAGFYGAPSIGCHVGLGKQMGISASWGYTAQCFKITEDMLTTSDGEYYQKHWVNHDGMTFKIAFDW